jgi:hypothetical protein
MLILTRVSSVSSQLKIQRDLLFCEPTDTMLLESHETSDEIRTKNNFNEMFMYSNEDFIVVRIEKKAMAIHKKHHIFYKPCVMQFAK